MTVNFTQTGPLFNGALGKIKQAMINATSETANVVKAKAISVYLRKKKSVPKLPSYIVDSFTYDLPFASNTQVRGVVFCNDVIAPWVRYVEFPRPGTRFPGYGFMKAGAEAGQQVIEQIAKDELNKLLNGVK